MNATLIAYTEKLTPTGLKIGSYSASVGDLVELDLTTNTFAVTIPATPADKSIIRLVVVKVGVGVCEVKCSGSDRFSVPTTGATSQYIDLQNANMLLQYKSSTGVWLVQSTAAPVNFANNNPGIDASTPITNADITINYSTRVLTITPQLGYFNILTDGYGKSTRFRKGIVNFPAFTNTSGSWYFYFNSDGVAVTTQSAWGVADFPFIAPVYRLLWNATLYNMSVTSANATVGATYTNNGVTFTVISTIALGTTLSLSGSGYPSASGTLTRASGTGDATISFSAFSEKVKAVSEYVENHENTISADIHEWFHLHGTVWATGFDISLNPLASGSPNADGRNSVIALTTGTNIDDNLEYSVANVQSPTAPWTQDLGNITPASLNATNGSLHQVRYQTAAGLASVLPATRFPFPWDSTTNIPQYITTTGARTPISSTNFFVVFLYASQNPRVGEAIRVITATAQFTSVVNARAYNWVDIQNSYPAMSDSERRPLYRLIFEYRSSYSSGAKYSVLRESQDLRQGSVTSTTAATGSMPASSVVVIPAGSIISTNVQSALEELDSEATARSLTYLPAINAFNKANYSGF